MPKEIEKDAEAKVVDYAFWNVPSSSATVVYSLPLFHEIDFVVNEGYRKIPHGGIEVGGLLFGKHNNEVTRIEAFRSIECEHASGPSLVMSERDLEVLKAQLSSFQQDPELEDLQPVGWFLAHTRSPMELTDTEASLFDRFFPEEGQLTMLVKPERFQPTRFGFLVRGGGTYGRDASLNAIILPLPGRVSRTGNELIPSIPAPTASAAAARRAAEAEGHEQSGDGKRPAVQKPDVPLSIWKDPPPEADDEPAADALPANIPAADEPDAADRAARKQLARERARVIGEAFLAPLETRLTSNSQNFPFRNSPLNAAGRALPYPMPQRYLPPATAPAPKPQFLAILILAALFGCIVGYIGYLQLPAAIIPLDVRAQTQSVVVSWPPEQTRNALYAAVRVDNSAPVPLSPEEKASGRIELSASNELKVEIIARNWMRDSRGVIRYIRSDGGNARALPSDPMLGK